MKAWLLLRSLLFYFGYSLSMVVQSLCATLIGLFSRDAAYAFCMAWCRFAVWWARACCGIRFNVTGLEHIPPGACVVLAKHESAWETLFLQTVFAPSTTVLKRELLSIPFFGWALRQVNPIAINRGEPAQALKALLRQGDQRLADGRRIIIFPEGTRALPGEQLPYNVGGAMLASRSGVPVIPVALNSGDCWPRGTLIKQPGTIHVVIGAPMHCAGVPAKVLNTRVRDWIEGERARLASAR
ncbi:MAG: lysophospholipid acyltransferase family protein [Gammaproteobacteria bacterium]